MGRQEGPTPNEMLHAPRLESLHGLTKAVEALAPAGDVSTTRTIELDFRHGPHIKLLNVYDQASGLMQVDAQLGARLPSGEMLIMSPFEEQPDPAFASLEYKYVRVAIGESFLYTQSVSSEPLKTWIGQVVGLLDVNPADACQRVAELVDSMPFENYIARCVSRTISRKLRDGTWLDYSWHEGNDLHKAQMAAKGLGMQTTIALHQPFNGNTGKDAPRTFLYHRYWDGSVELVTAKSKPGAAVLPASLAQPADMRLLRESTPPEAVHNVLDILALRGGGPLRPASDRDVLQFAAALRQAKQELSR